jgi:hypothetical protein
MAYKYGGVDIKQRISPTRSSRLSTATGGSSSTTASSSTRGEGEPEATTLLPAKKLTQTDPTAAVMATVEKLESRYLRGWGRSGFMALSFPIRNFICTSVEVCRFAIRTLWTWSCALLVMIGLCERPRPQPPLTKEQARALSRVAPPEQPDTIVSWALRWVERAWRMGWTLFVVHIMIEARDVYYSINFSQRMKLATTNAELCKVMYPDVSKFTHECTMWTQFANRPFLLNWMSDVWLHVLTDLQQWTQWLMGSLGVPLAWCGSGTHCNYILAYLFDNIVHYIFYVLPLCILAGFIYFVYFMSKEMMMLKIALADRKNDSAMMLRGGGGGGHAYPYALQPAASPFYGIQQQSTLSTSRGGYITYNEHDAPATPSVSEPGSPMPALPAASAPSPSHLAAPKHHLPLLPPVPAPLGPLSSSSSSVPGATAGASVMPPFAHRPLTTYGSTPGAVPDPIFSHRPPFEFLQQHTTTSSQVIPWQSAVTMPVSTSPASSSSSTAAQSSPHIRVLSRNQFHLA